ncbi:MAG: HAD family hydrolase [Gammaproteobacteria bacterium]|nr:HAD family hydrolase [Gammaproteobacteria bacterium]
MQQTSFIFDLDGTIWDSRPWFEKAICHLSTATAATITREFASEGNFVRVANNLGIKPLQLIRLATKGTVGTVLRYDGVKSTLAKLQSQEVLLGIASNLPGNLARAHLSATDLLQYFDEKYIGTPRRGIPSKPNPRGINELIRRMNQQYVPETYWLIGDAISDAEAAIAAEVKFIWASYGYTKEEPPKTSRAFKRFDELLEL